VKLIPNEVAIDLDRLATPPSTPTLALYPTFFYSAYFPTLFLKNSLRSEIKIKEGDNIRSYTG